MLRFSLGFAGVLLALGVAYAIYKFIEESKENKNGNRKLRKKSNDDIN